MVADCAARSRDGRMGVPCSGAADRRKLWFGFGFLMLAAIPVHEFLLIDANLEKSRVLYLPSVGFALIFAAALEAARPRLAVAAACAILAFQTAALEHNLLIWHRISALAASTCASVAAFPERRRCPISQTSSTEFTSCTPGFAAASNAWTAGARISIWRAMRRRLNRRRTL